MTRAWKIVCWVAAALFVVGLVLIGAGLLSGASTHRILNEAFGGQDGFRTWLDGLWAQLRALPALLRELF